MTHKLKLLPNEEQKDALLIIIMERFNEACNFVATAVFRIKSANKLRLQKEIYYELRERFNLPAQLAIRAIAKVGEAYKRDKSIRPQFDDHMERWYTINASSLGSMIVHPSQPSMVERSCRFSPAITTS